MIAALAVCLLAESPRWGSGVVLGATLCGAAEFGIAPIGVRLLAIAVGLGLIAVSTGLWVRGSWREAAAAAEPGNAARGVCPRCRYGLRSAAGGLSCAECGWRSTRAG